MLLRDAVDPTVARIAARSIARGEVVLGAFQRAASALRGEAVLSRGLLVTRRLSGGPAVLAAPGSLHVALSLPRPDALTPCEPGRLVNRYVRPLLRGLGALGAPARFFGRDWVSVGKRPAAWVGFAHDAESGRSWVEAIVGVGEPVSLPHDLDGYPARATDPLLGNAPASLSEIAGGPLEPERVAELVLRAYDRAYGGPLARAPWSDRDLRPLAEDRRPPWDAVVEEAIGFVGAAASPCEAGGDLLASEEVVAALGAGMAALGAAPSRSAIAALVAAAASRGVLEGVRDAASIERAIAAALGVPFE